jgi:hypothetical protein
MIIADARYEMIRRRAVAEVLWCTRHGMSRDDELIAGAIRAITAGPWATWDCWSQETAVAVAQRAALATVAALRRAGMRPGCSRGVPSRWVPAAVLGLLIGALAALGGER